MRLLPAGLSRPSDHEDGEWLEKPGFPPTHGTWLHPRPDGLPEFEFEEGHDKTKNDPPFRMTIGTHEDAQIRLDDPRIPRRHCMIFKEGHAWFVERLSAKAELYLSGKALELGVPAQLASGDVFSLLEPPSAMAYRVEFEAADNWYLDLRSDKDYPNKWPAKMPGHPSESPPAPEELKRLAWQTDQMRRRSEEDQVRVADWAAFSQYVKKHYHKYGIFAKPWAGSVGPPVERPPLPGPRAYPSWIAELLAQEAMPPYVNREYPFREALELSGYTCRAPLQAGAPLPEGPVSGWGDAGGEASCFKSGGTGVMVGDATLYEAVADKSLAFLEQGSAAAASVAAAAATEAAPSHGGPSRLPEGQSRRSTTATPPGQPASGGPSVSFNLLPALDVSFRDWLSAMEDAPFVIQYHDAIAAQLDSLRQLVDLYVRDGELDERFFSIAGVAKLGHKRIFQKWFREHCDPDISAERLD